VNFRGPQRRRRATTAIDITALVDVVFLLLIFLLVTTTFRRDEYAFEIDLPTSSSEHVVIAADRTTVFVGSDGSLHLLTVPTGDEDDEAREEITKAPPLSPKELRTRLESLHAKDPDASIAVRGARDASYEQLLRVVGVIQDVGFPSIWFPYEHEAAGPE